MWKEVQDELNPEETLTKKECIAIDYVCLQIFVLLKKILHYRGKIDY